MSNLAHRVPVQSVYPRSLSSAHPFYKASPANSQVHLHLVHPIHLQSVLSFLIEGDRRYSFKRHTSALDRPGGTLSLRPSHYRRCGEYRSPAARGGPARRGGGDGEYVSGRGRSVSRRSSEHPGAEGKGSASGRSNVAGVLKEITRDPRDGVRCDHGTQSPTDDGGRPAKAAG